MTRRFSGDTLMIASHNKGKIREIADLLSAHVASFPSAADHGLTDPEETGDTFRANAELKALVAARATGLPSLADDSGLAVTALEGAPGIYSARWAERDNGVRDFDYAMRRVNDALGNAPDRSATFVSALSLAWPDGHTETVEGTVDGMLIWPPRGDHGFGYDPIFVPDGGTITFAEMEPEAKHAISHRAVAFDKLLARCFP